MRLLLCAAFAVVASCAPPAEAPIDAPAAEIEATQAPDAELAIIAAPQSGASVSSPLRVSGVAPANWFFENQFPVRLLDAEGREIAMAPAYPRINWTEPGPKEFGAELTFDAEGAATLVLEEDMPGEGETPRQVRIPLTLVRE